MNRIVRKYFRYLCAVVLTVCMLSTCIACGSAKQASETQTESSEISSTESTTAETSATETTVTESSTAETTTAESTTAETSSAETTAAETSAAETSANSQNGSGSSSSSKSSNKQSSSDKNNNCQPETSPVSPTESTETTAETTESTEYTEETTEAAAVPFKYIHDPRLQASAMTDIIENPDAVYGFSPNPESKRLGVFASYDWTDPEFVETQKQERIKYEESLNSMWEIVDEMKSEGKNTEEIARAVSAERNRLRLAAYENDPEGLEKAKKSNLDTYGNEEGPTADYLYEKYGSWDTVLQKAFSMNLGADICCGLYDENYSKYIELGLIKE